jgi:hypothetical protein
MDTLHVPTDRWDELHTYLDHPTERIAFLAAVPTSPLTAEPTSRDGAAWRVVDVMYLDDDRDYAYQGWDGVELADDLRPRTLKWATSLNAALIEVHSHGVGRLPTTFSTTDLRGLLDAVPGLVWRLAGRPYAAIVVGGREDHDSLTWVTKNTAATAIDRLVVGDTSLQPTGLAAIRLTDLRENG